MINKPTPDQMEQLRYLVRYDKLVRALGLKLQDYSDEEILEYAAALKRFYDVNQPKEGRT